MLDGLGIDTGVDLRSWSTTTGWMAGHLGRPARPGPSQALTKAAAVPPPQ